MSFFILFRDRFMMTRFIRVGILWLLVALIFSACHSHRPIPEPLTVKVLVIDFNVADDIVSSSRQIKGWWFGARDVYQNPNAGSIFADILAKRLNKEVSCVDVYSRTDYVYYSANKKDRLKKAFPKLDDGAIDGIFVDVSPVEFARDLGLDKVIMGKLRKCYTAHNRAFHWWSSVVDVDVILLDAESGQPEWSGHIKMRSKFRSQFGTMELVAHKLVKRIKKEYFYR